jgi:hypothetical protein
MVMDAKGIRESALEGISPFFSSIHAVLLSAALIVD